MPRLHVSAVVFILISCVFVSNSSFGVVTVFGLNFRCGGLVRSLRELSARPARNEITHRFLTPFATSSVRASVSLCLGRFAVSVALFACARS